LASHGHDRGHQGHDQFTEEEEDPERSVPLHEDSLIPPARLDDVDQAQDFAPVTSPKSMVSNDRMPQ
jgi:hypothetical protein